MDSDDSDEHGLPKSWRLGNRPNLRQMHDEACAQRVAGNDVETHLREAVSRAKSALDGGAFGCGRESSHPAAVASGTWATMAISAT